MRGLFPAHGTYVGLAGNARSRGLLDQVTRAMRSVPGLPVETLLLPKTGAVLPESQLSDHASFWEQGYPALLVTDTAFFRNPHYHQPTDTVATLDLDFLAKVTEGLVRFVVSCAGSMGQWFSASGEPLSH